MSDPRFAALSHDPRYRLPNRKEARTAVDPRFSRLFTSQDFNRKAKVDRYGRKVKPEQGRKDLERLYRLEERPGKVGTEQVEKEVVGSSDDEDASEDEVEEKAVTKRDPAREGGFSESEEEGTSDEEEDSEVEAELAEETAGQEQDEDIPVGEVSRRIAAVNLDWDHIRAADVMAVAASFIPSSGRIERVTVYPSEFGRERLEREELEGPPREIFASFKRDDNDKEDEDAQDLEEDEEVSDDEEEDEKIKRRLLSQQASDGHEFDTTALRQYQLERLRYYYAVITCDTPVTAKSLYDSMDGREYLTTANFFDLRFIPDTTSFEDDEPREECRRLEEGYKPNDFRTEALTHSKVRLTWDDDDTTRKEVQKRAFSRAEVEENDLQAYIGSEESDADSVTSRKSAAEDRRAKKKAEQRRAMRERLGLGEEVAVGRKKTGGKEEVVGDMQITFTSGLSGGAKGSGESGKGGVFENEPQDEESTRARYIRKERERKQKRKEKGKAGTSDLTTAADAEAGAAAEVDEAAPEDAGFDDAFFNDPAAALAAEKKARKAARQEKRDAKAAKEAEEAGRRKELELLMAEDDGDAVRHFDMRDVEKAEKDAKRKGKKGKKAKQKSAEDVDDGLGDGAREGEGGFRLDTQDKRFGALFESHEYAIDPTNPRFKGTEGMKGLLEEGRRKRKRGDVEEAPGEEGKTAPAKANRKRMGEGEGEGGKVLGEKDDELKGLVARLKGGGRGKK